MEKKLNIPTKRLGRLKNIDFTTRRYNNNENIGKYLNALGSIIRI